LRGDLEKMDSRTDAITICLADRLDHLLTGQRQNEGQDFPNDSARGILDPEIK
jgi:hypothetical protein